MAMRNVAVVVLLALAWSPAVLAQAGNSEASIAGAFSDSCRDLESVSTKDISYVQIHYADGRVVKDESIRTPGFSIDGGAGFEIDFAVVKSGTTVEQFFCHVNRAPVALLEIKTPAECFTAIDGSVFCDWSAPTAWMSPGLVRFSCGPVPCSTSITVRGSGSVDGDGDLVSWSIDFGDGTIVSGSWANPPVEISHRYADGVSTHTVVLTVTDSAGQTTHDSMIVEHDNDGFD